MRLAAGCARLLTGFRAGLRVVLSRSLPAARPRVFRAQDRGIPLILSLATPKAAFPMAGNRGNNPPAKRLKTPPTPCPRCNMDPEYTGTPRPCCKAASYCSHVGWHASVMTLSKV